MRFREGSLCSPASELPDVKTCPFSGRRKFCGTPFLSKPLWAFGGGYPGGAVPGWEMEMCFSAVCCCCRALPVSCPEFTGDLEAGVVEKGRSQLYNQKGVLLGYTAKQPQSSSGMEITFFSFSSSSSSSASSLSSVLGARTSACCGPGRYCGHVEPCHG